MPELHKAEEVANDINTHEANQFLATASSIVLPSLAYSFKKHASRMLRYSFPIPPYGGFPKLWVPFWGSPPSGFPCSGSILGFPLFMETTLFCNPGSCIGVVLDLRNGRVWALQFPAQN